MPYRDTQKNLLYKAEAEAGIIDYVFEDARELKEFVSHVTNSNWWKKNSQIKKVVIRSRKDAKYPKMWSKYDNIHKELIGYISIPPEIRTKCITLHLLAHAMNLVDVINYKYSNHGVQFCKLYLMLIKQYMGRTAWLKMKKSFRNYGVKFRPRNGKMNSDM